MLTIRFRFVSSLSSLSWVSCLLVLLLSPLPASAANLLGPVGITPPSPAIYVGETIQLTAIGRYDDGTQQVIVQAKQVSAGGVHVCALSTDSTVKCWGGNGAGQLGDGTTTDSPAPVIVSGLTTAVAVSAGGLHTCASLIDGTVRCWGDNNYGQLGNGTTTNSSTPVAVSGISSAEAVSAGAFHACAVLANGTVQCWGRNYFGQLGNGTNKDSPVPVAVSGINTAVAVGTGYEHSCALLADGGVRCWGINNTGELGNGTRINSSIPVVVSDIGTAVAISAGGFTLEPPSIGHNCAVLADGTLRCWGGNNYGQLGNGSVAYFSSTPVTVSGIGTAVNVSTGGNHACAMLADGTLHCWGQNNVGQLGNGMTVNSSTPVVVTGFSSAAAVSSNVRNTCAARADGTVWCWGGNDYGQLGNGTISSSSITPSSMPTPTLDFYSLVWSSLSSPGIASVDEIGRVQGLAAGEAQITVAKNGYSALTRVTILGNSPVVSDLNVIAVTGVSTGWTPFVSDPDGGLYLICRLGTPPANGTATIAANCASGTYQSYPGFIGIDSFTYIANDGQSDSNPATVTLAVIDGDHSTACTAQYPVYQFNQTGKDGTLTISFTGNITSHTNKEVKVCPGTTLSYQSTSTQGPVICKIKNSTTRGSGTLRIKDHLKCTDKPAGQDKVHFKVKSGVAA